MGSKNDYSSDNESYKSKSYRKKCKDKNECNNLYKLMMSYPILMWIWVFFFIVIILAIIGGLWKYNRITGKR